MGDGVAFFDTNVLVAASVSHHAQFRPAISRLASLKDGRGACAAHTLAEAYNTMTNYPRGYGVAPIDAWRILAYARLSYRLISLSADEAAGAIEAASQSNIKGGRIYDALLLACARKVDAETIYTFDVKHFRLIAPDLASRIVQP